MAVDIISNGTNAKIKSTTEGSDEVPHVNVDGSLTIGTVTPASAFFTGQTTITAAGTSEALASTQALTSGVTVKALAANTSIVFASATAAGSDESDQFELSAGEQQFFDIDDLDKVTIDSLVNSEGVCFSGS